MSPQPRAGDVGLLIIPNNDMFTTSVEFYYPPLHRQGRLDEGEAGIKV